MRLPVTLLLVCAGLVLSDGASVAAEPGDLTPGARVRACVKDGTVAYRLTTPDELKKILGDPSSEKTSRDGDREVLVLSYAGLEAGFGKLPGPAVFTLFWARERGRLLDIGQQRQVVLRTADDLKKLDSFWGCAGVSLARLDLREHRERLAALTFDTLTVWPEPGLMPSGFDPVRVLEDGKNPGLGIRALHRAGIDGRGVGLAIIDQPLLLEHEEFREAIVKYEELEVKGVPVQMHGPPVASIAVGRSCGVAPKAALYYFAVPPWKWTENRPWADALNRIVRLNDTLTNAPKIRVVSISLGAFSMRPNFSQWAEAVKRAEQAGILVVTCDPKFLRLAMLKRTVGKSGEEAADYVRGLYAHPNPELCVPAANRTMASFRGARVYTFDRSGGMSWAVPYLAGLAALGWQVDPSLKPSEVVTLWTNTATKTPAGPVVNPEAFLAALKARSKE